MPDQTRLPQRLRAVCATCARPLSGQQVGARPAGMCSCSSSPFGPTSKPEAPERGRHACEPCLQADWQLGWHLLAVFWVGACSCVLCAHSSPAIARPWDRRRGWPGGLAEVGARQERRGLPLWWEIDGVAEAGVLACPPTGEGAPLQVHCSGPVSRPFLMVLVEATHDHALGKSLRTCKVAVGVSL